MDEGVGLSKYSKCELPCPKLQHMILGQVPHTQQIFDMFFFSTGSTLVSCLALVSHHPSEVCHIHPLPSKLFCSQCPIFLLHVSLRLVIITLLDKVICQVGISKLSVSPVTVRICLSVDVADLKFAHCSDTGMIDDHYQQ